MNLLKDILDLRDKSILVVGDTMVDRFVWGKVSRISPEAPVPVVEVKEKSDHVIVINDNGTEKYYQPIGILPATYNTYTSGANRLAKLRDLASTQDQNQLIKDEKGNVVSTTAIGHVTATPPAHLQENQSVVHIGMSSLNANEKAEMQGKSKEEARKTAEEVRTGLFIVESPVQGQRIELALAEEVPVFTHPFFRDARVGKEQVQAADLFDVDQVEEVQILQQHVVDVGPPTPIHPTSADGLIQVAQVVVSQEEGHIVWMRSLE